MTGGKTAIDLVKSPAQPADEVIGQAHFKDILDEKLEDFSKGLTEREGKIFRERLLAEVPLTLQAIADQYGISRERARQIEEKIKKNLKNYFEQEGLHLEEHI